MRFVIYGAGAIGGVVGARLAQSGRDVALIARGAHHDAIAADGLRLLDVDGEHLLRLPVASSPAELGISDDDVILLCMKSQHTVGALQDLRTAHPEVPVACLQNGVANEREALRRFARVQGVTVLLPAQHLEPGLVIACSAPTTGMLDPGCYPEGTDVITEKLVGAFSGATFHAIARPDVQRWKYAKLRVNLGNILQVLCGTDADSSDARQLLVVEAEACFAAAGIDVATSQEDEARRGDRLKFIDLPGHPYQGGSSWQSATRGTGNLETDYLNGEIVLLGRTHGVPVPANATVCRLAARVAAGSLTPGSLQPKELLSLLSR